MHCQDGLTTETSRGPMWFPERVQDVELKNNEETNLPEFDETSHLILRENSGHVLLCFCSVVKFQARLKKWLEKKSM